MRRAQVLIDRFDVANASFWLDQVAAWLADPDHAEQLADDLWPGFAGTGTPVSIIVSQAAAGLRAALRDTRGHGPSR